MNAPGTNGSTASPRRPRGLPHTLSRGQFQQQRPGGSYQRYIGYVTAKRAQRAGGQSTPHPAPRPAQRPIDPFASVTERELNRRANVFGRPMSDQEIQQAAGREAHAQIDPILAQIEAEIGRRSAAEQQHLAGATADYAQQVSQFAPQAHEAYQGAETSQANVNAALSQALAGGGQQLASELAAKLGATGAPAGQVADVTAGAAGVGRGAGNAALATGSAELSRLLGGDVAAQEYGAKLPGIARAEGLQRSSETAGRYAEELRRRNEQVTSELPGLIQGLVGTLTSRSEGRRQNRASSIDAERNRALQAGIARQSGLVNTIRAKATATGANTRARTDQQKLHESKRQHLVAERMAAEALGLNVAEYRHKVAHDTTTERQDAAKLGITVQQLREQRRHNQAQETHQQAQEQHAKAQERQAIADAKAKGREIDPALSAQKGVVVGKDGKPILRYHLDKNGHRVPGSGKTIPYKASKGKGGKGSLLGQIKGK